MGTSGTYAFFEQLEAVDVLAESFERCGIDFSRVAGNQLESGRRSLQMAISELGNKGPNLWKVELQSFPLSSGQNTITMTDEVIEILQAYVRDSSASPPIDYVVTEISRSDFAALPYKTQTGDRPTQFYFDRQITPIINVWPVQDNTTKTFFSYSWLLQEDIGALINQVDAPNRWIDAICANAAARIAVKWAPERVALLQGLSDSAFAAAAAEDVENVPLRITPNLLGSRFV